MRGGLNRPVVGHRVVKHGPIAVRIGRHDFDRVSLGIIASALNAATCMVGDYRGHS